MLKFKFMPVKFNFSSRKGQKVKNLVIHDTGNHSVGAGALNHYKYFNGGNRGASAHYFVDDKEIIQIVGDSFASWHCGDNQGRGRALNGVTNSNSIGIELCVNKDGNYEKAYNNLIELVKNLMVKFNISHNNVVRHYDVSRKSCPDTFKANNWARWNEFKKAIQEPIKIKLDLSKDSVGEKVQEKELEVRAEEEKTEAINKDIVKIKLNNKLIKVKGHMIKDVNYVSVRDLAEAMGLEVGWDNNTREVILKG